MPDTPALSIRNLIVTGDRGRRILAVDQMAVPAGEIIGIRGPSGAGKSTLLNALAGLVDGATGDVNWGQTNLIALCSQVRSAFRAKHIGMIFQDFLLFDELSASLNASIAALYAPKAERQGLRDNAQAELTNRAIQTTARSVASFSGGERQRVAVARALAHDPAIILADEPTANLDPTTGEALITDLIARARAKTRTLIIVSHDNSVLERMDRVLTISDGQIAAPQAA